MNALAGTERAIVTPIAGTTRDVLRDVVRIDGVELTLVDTAGLRETQDVVEAEGIRRARAEVAKADLVLAVLDDREAEAAMARLRDELAVPSTTNAPRPERPALLWLHTHADLTGAAGHEQHGADGHHLWIDTPRGIGLDALRAALRDAAGAGEGADSGGAFSARARHVDAIVRVGTHLVDAAMQLRARQGELAAEDLRLAQDALGEITGRVSSDALLGRIFSSFCIGK
jgi:tRNA modification GTPase